jgi:hypothetical protein
MELPLLKLGLAIRAGITNATQELVEIDKLRLQDLSLHILFSLIQVMWLEAAVVGVS